MTLADRIEAGTVRKPWLCRLGIHGPMIQGSLITTGTVVCTKCGTGWITSLFGDGPDLSPAECAEVLRAKKKIDQGLT